MTKPGSSKLFWKVLPCSEILSSREKFSCDQHVNKIYLYGGVVDSYHSNQLEVISFEQLAAKKPSLTQMTQISESLMNHDSICSIDGLLMIFGGRTPSGLTNKLQVYDITKSVWFELNTKGEVPSKRERHTITLIEASIYVFGGLCESSDRKPEITNEFYKLAMETSTWQRVITKKTPKPRYGHTTVAINSKLLVFGGKSHVEILNDLPQFDVSKDVEWRIIKALGRSPPPRWGHSACVVSDKYMVIYGGWNGKTTLADLFLLDSGDYVWWEVLLTSQIPRAYGKLLYREESLYYIGGRTDTEVRKEILKFNFSSLLSSGYDQFIFDIDTFTIKDKPADQRNSLLDHCKFVKVLKHTPIELFYIGEDTNGNQFSTEESKIEEGNTFYKTNKEPRKSEEMSSLVRMKKSPGGSRFSEILVVPMNKTEDEDIKSHRLNFYYMIRKMKKEGLISEGKVEKVLMLRQALPTIEHPFINSVKMFDKDMKHLYMISRIVAGGSLYNCLYKLEKKFAPNIIRFYAAQIYLALTYIQSKNLVYRNLRPETIFIARDGYLKLAELTEINKASQTEKVFSVVGPPEYHTPEMVQNKEYGSEVDWWAFGILLYEMLYKKTPFEANDPNLIYENILKAQITFEEGIDKDLKDLITRLLTPELEKRLGYGNLEEIKNHLFFKGVDFEQILLKTIKPPFKPNNDYIQRFLQEDEDHSIYELFQGKPIPGGPANDPFKDF